MSGLFDRKKLAFLAAFIAASLAASKINFSPLLGTENQYFTLFQFLSPIGGGIFGSGFGAVAALAAQAVSTAATGAPISAFNLLLLFPPACAAWYFGAKGRAVLAVPLACMALFWLNPVGAQAPLYALFWLVPVAASLARQNLLARSLGTTFTAHAVGSVAFIYSIPSTPELWMALIPVVIAERAIFAAGIAATFVTANAILGALSSKTDLSSLSIDRSPSLWRLQGKRE
jgi:hypothetical protein